MVVKASTAIGIIAAWASSLLAGPMSPMVVTTPAFPGSPAKPTPPPLSVNLGTLRLLKSIESAQLWIASTSSSADSSARWLLLLHSQPLRGLAAVVQLPAQKVLEPVRPVAAPGRHRCRTCQPR